MALHRSRFTGALVRRQVPRPRRWHDGDSRTGDTPRVAGGLVLRRPCASGERRSSADASYADLAERVTRSSLLRGPVKWFAGGATSVVEPRGDVVHQHGHVAPPREQPDQGWSRGSALSGASGAVEAIGAIGAVGGDGRAASICGGCSSPPNGRRARAGRVTWRDARVREASTPQRRARPGRGRAGALRNTRTRPHARRASARGRP